MFLGIHAQIHFDLSPETASAYTQFPFQIHYYNFLNQSPWFLLLIVILEHDLENITFRSSDSMSEPRKTAS